MVQTLGHYRESDSDEYMMLGFSASRAPLEDRWRTNDLSANFIAYYVSTYFPRHDKAAIELQANVQDAVSFIANELLENAMKFAYEPARQPMSIKMALEPEFVYFYVSNSVDPATLASFQGLIRELLTSDVHQLYLQRLEQNALGTTQHRSGIGLLTMLTDYNAQIAWQFLTTAAATMVTTMVALPINS